MYFAKLAKFTTHFVADEEEPLGSFKDWRNAEEVAIEALRKKPRNAGWVAQVMTSDFNVVSYITSDHNHLRITRLADALYW